MIGDLFHHPNNRDSPTGANFYHSTESVWFRPELTDGEDFVVPLLKAAAAIIIHPSSAAVPACSVAFMVTELLAAYRFLRVIFSQLFSELVPRRQTNAV